MAGANIDQAVVKAFGHEWTRFDQRALGATEHRNLFQSYFTIFPWHALRESAEGADIGCGSGRWAKLVAPRVGTLHCLDASLAALYVAREGLRGVANVHFHHASVDELPFEDWSLDFAYCLGVLHHVPEPQQALTACVRKLKGGAPFLVYLYYRFDNRPVWFRVVWKASDVMRRGISRLPNRLRYLVTQGIAAGVYWPLSRVARLLEGVGIAVDPLPLSAYRDKSFYTMRTDALDRFGTRLEHRFTRCEIEEMMGRAGLENIQFHEGIPYWCVLGWKRTA